MLKQCQKCTSTKETTEFYRADANTDGLQKWCKTCDNDRHLEYQRARQRRLGKKERITQRFADELRAKGLRRCPTCKEVKALSSFYQAGKSNGGYASHCIICCNLQDKRKYTKKYYRRDKAKVRSGRLLKRYGVTSEWYDQKLKEQKGLCAICGGKDKKKHLAVDHNHKTKQIRGLLCGRCNPAIGYLRDSAELAKKLVMYLDNYQEAVE